MITYEGILIFYINYKVSIFNFKQIKGGITAKKNLFKDTKVFSWNLFMFSTQVNDIKGKETKSEG